MERARLGIFPNENFVDLNLYQFGFEACEPCHSFGPAKRNHFLFHYIISGKGTFRHFDRQNENEYRLEAGQGFLIWPQRQTLYFADEKNPWKYTWVEFDGLQAQELVTQAGLTYNYPIYSGEAGAEREKMKNEMLAIVDTPKDAPFAAIGHFYLFASAFIASSSARKKVTGGSIRDFYVRESLTFIEQHYQEEIGVEDIAANCSLDRSYLGKIFKKELHTSPQEFLIRYRINKACRLLQITTHTIGEISLMVGYQNQFNFSRIFKHITGQSPRDWRNEHRLQRISAGKEAMPLEAI